MAEPRVAGVILAAGSSTRMGENKLLLEWGGETLLARAVRASRDAALDTLVVVGHEAERVAAELQGSGCRTVHNGEYAEGIHTSIRAGIAAATAGCEAAIILLPDMPRVSAAMLEALVERYREKRPPLVISCYGELIAPPTLFDRSLFCELLALEGGTGKEVVQRHRARAAELHWPHDWLRDVDTPEDLWRLSADPC